MTETAEATNAPEKTSTEAADPATSAIPENRSASSPALSTEAVGASPSTEPSSEDPANSDETATAAESSSGTAKKPRAQRTPKAAGKPVELGGSITTIVERVVRMTTLSDEHCAALGRLFNVSLPEDYVARLTRLTAASLGPIGNGAAEALAIVLGLESANPIHVGVQLGRLATASLPDVYRCAHALTGETAPALPKGDNAVFAVADVLATLTADDFALARALSTALE